MGALAATGQPTLQSPFAPMPTGFTHVPAGSIDELERAVTSTTAAVMVETIQGEGGVVPLEAGYLAEVRALCDEREMLLIVDDVQAGIGRTGNWFSWQDLGFVPDVATVAKALGNGLPIGACLARDEIASAFSPGDHGTTFGGGPVVSRAALAVLDEIENKDLLAACRERSRQFGDGLSALPGVTEVRGRGLLFAVGPRRRPSRTCHRQGHGSRSRRQRRPPRCHPLRTATHHHRRRGGCGGGAVRGGPLDETEDGRRQPIAPPLAALAPPPHRRRQDRSGGWRTLDYSSVQKSRRASVAS